MFESPQCGKPALSEADDDLKCAICWDGESTAEDPLIICEGKKSGCIAVHKTCYGIANVPDGPFLCQKCTHAKPDDIHCAICKRKEGAIRRTADGDWVHTECVWWTKEYCGGELNLKKLREACPERANVSCEICKGRGGAQECLFGDCMRAVHPYCARNLVPPRKRWMLRVRENEGTRNFEMFCDEVRGGESLSDELRRRFGVLLRDLKPSINHPIKPSQTTRYAHCSIATWRGEPVRFSITLTIMRRPRLKTRVLRRPCSTTMTMRTRGRAGSGLRGQRIRRTSTERVNYGPLS